MLWWKGDSIFVSGKRMQIDLIAFKELKSSTHQLHCASRCYPNQTSFLLCSLGCKDLSITHITRWMLVALRTFKNKVFLLFCWHKRILGVLITRSLSWLKLRTWNTFSNKAVSCVLMLSVSSWQHVNKVHGKLIFFRACVTVTLKICIAIKRIVQPKQFNYVIIYSCCSKTVCISVFC